MPLLLLAESEGFEPTTPWFVAKYSIQLSYGRAFAHVALLYMLLLCKPANHASNLTKMKPEPLTAIRTEQIKCSDVARPAGFEPTTPWFVAKYSIQLSYGRVAAKKAALYIKF